MPDPEPEGLAPTLGVVLLRKLAPNCAVPGLEAVWLPRAAIVGDPAQEHVRVDPLTVIEYPDVPLVEAAMTDVPVFGFKVSNVPKLTELPATVPQLVPVIDVPVQKTSDSSIVPLSVIAVAVLAATVPVSTAVVQAASENKVILA